jgi:hypothetical protein
VPNHDLTLNYVIRFSLQLSANPFDRLVLQLEHVANYFPLDLELVLQGGACKMVLNQPLLVSNNEAVLYRLVLFQ